MNLDKFKELKNQDIVIDDSDKTGFTYINSNGFSMTLASLTVATISVDGFNGWYETGDENKIPVRREQGGNRFLIIVDNGIKMELPLTILKHSDAIKRRLITKSGRDLLNFEESERNDMESF